MSRWRLYGPPPPETGLREHHAPWCWSWGFRWAPSELPYFPSNALDPGRRDSWPQYHMERRHHPASRLGIRKSGRAKLL